MTMRRAAATALLVLVAALTGCSSDDSSSTSSGGLKTASAPPPKEIENVPAAPQGSGGKPNLLVVMTDDQTTHSYRPDVMPSTRAFFAHGGSNLSQAIAAPPLCCPARSTYLTGDYTQNSGVISNVPGYSSMKDKENVLPVWLHEAGYRTAMIGKFLNAYEKVGGSSPAPGWDRWFELFRYGDYFGSQVSDQGKVKTLGKRTYTTDELTRQALDFLGTKHRQPFFMWLSYNAPHTVPGYGGECRGTTPQPRNKSDYKPFARSPLPKGPAYDEADISDKPLWVQHRPLNKVEIKAAQRRWRCEQASLVAVDQGFASVVDSLRASDSLDNTIVVFLSDNGWFYGEHRIDDDKRLAYEPALRVPLAIRVGSDVDSGTQPRDLDQLISFSDIAPTLLDYAGAKPCPAEGACRTLDGRSLRPLLRGSDPSWARERAIPFQLDDGFTYSAIRTPDHLYVETSGDRKGPFPTVAPELYDLGSDPNELENLAPRKGTNALTAPFARRLQSLARCAGVSGRDKRRAGHPFCS